MELTVVLVVVLAHLLIQPLLMLVVALGILHQLLQAKEMLEAQSRIVHPVQVVVVALVL